MEMVKKLQIFLNSYEYGLVIDGIAGPKTKSAFENYKIKVFAMEDQEMIWPAPGRISSPYGNRKHPVTGVKGRFHNGIDIACAEGTPVVSPADGKVTSTYDNQFGGLTMIILHDNGLESRMCHLNKYLASPGDRVGQGEAVAESGNTGRSTGAHLHYGIKDAGKNYVDPEDYLKKEES